MTLESFFKKFDTFANAPNAVAKMRELVLELAIRGNLTANNPYDRDNPSNPSVFFPISSDWRWTTLCEAADCRASDKVSPSMIADAAWVLDLEDIDGSKGQITQTATFAERRSLSTKAAFLPDDVLYGKLRPYLNKVVVAKNPGYCTTEIIPLRPHADLLPEFLRYFLRSATFLNYAAQKNYGMKMPRLGTKDLEATAIPLPPLAEQKRIVAKVDELMALCDRLEAQQQERETRHADLARASLARFADAPTPIESVQGFFAASAKLHLVADERTAAPVAEFSAAFGKLLMQIISKTVPLQMLQIDIEILSGLYERFQGDANRVISERGRMVETGNKDHALFDLLGRAFESHQEMASQHADQRNAKYKEYSESLKQFSLFLMKEMKVVSQLQIPLLVALRRDLGFDTDIRFYKDQLDRQYQVMITEMDRVHETLSAATINSDSAQSRHQPLSDL